MNITLLSINSKYVHSSLSLWYLAAACVDCGAIIPIECSINEPEQVILQKVFDSNPDTLAISCYIWNIDIVLRLCRKLNLLLPDLRIFLGGPEVSFRAMELMNEHPEIDAIFLGEGEETLPAYLKGFLPDGIVYRTDNKIIKKGGYCQISTLDTLRSPYTPQMLATLDGKLAYYESSRGCPFSCSYCLSSATSGVRTFSIDRVISDIKKLVSANVQTIKFVDRTFNADKKRAKSIVRFLLALECDTTFHFEVGADLFDDELLSLLKSAPAGKFQIEAGIQSTNEQTLKAVCRSTDTKKALATLEEISSWGNIHVHADLICGLPHESLDIFKTSFNDLFSTRPHALQVGFLKLLHGSALRNEFNGKFSPFPPYQVLESDCLAAKDLFFLQNFEKAVDLFYNSGRFSATISYLATCFNSAYELFSLLSSELCGKSSLSPDNLFLILKKFGTEHHTIDKSRLDAALSFDYFSSFKSKHLPNFLKEPTDSFHLAEKGEIPSLYHIPVKVLAKQIVIKTFPYDMSLPTLPHGSTTYVFSRTIRDLVTDRFEAKKLQMTGC